MATLQHDRRQKVIFAGRQHALFKHRPRRENSGHLPPHQPLSFGGILGLVTEGHRIALFHQLRRIALDRVVRYTGHGYAPNIFAALLGSQHQLQHFRDRASILKKSLEKVAHSIEQQGLGMLFFDRDIVLHHRRELIAVQQPIVSVRNLTRRGRGTHMAKGVFRSLS